MRDWMVFDECILRKLQVAHLGAMLPPCYYVCRFSFCQARYFVFNVFLVHVLQFTLLPLRCNNLLLRICSRI